MSTLFYHALAVCVCLFFVNSSAAEDIVQPKNLVIKQIVNDDLAIISSNIGDFALEMDTTNHVDDTPLRTPIVPFVQIGRYQYVTVLGAKKTIRKLRMVDLEKDFPNCVYLRTKQRGKQKPNLLIGNIVEYKGGQVHFELAWNSGNLRGIGGSNPIVRLRMSQFDSDSKKLIRDWRKKQKGNH